MYNFSGLPLFGGVRTGELTKYCLIFSKAFWWLSSHLKSCFYFNFNNEEKRWTFPTELEINHLRKLIFPKWICSSLFRGGEASLMDFALFLSTSIPLWWTKKPRKFPALTPSAHFLGFIFNWCCLILRITSLNSATWFGFSWDLMTTSSIYTSKKKTYHIIEYRVHGSLIGSRCIFLTKWQHNIFKSAYMSWTYKRRVVNLLFNQIIPYIPIHEWQDLILGSSIH